MSDPIQVYPSHFTPIPARGSQSPQIKRKPKASPRRAQGEPSASRWNIGRVGSPCVGLALAMYILSFWCQIHSHWAANENLISGRIWALHFSVSRSHLVSPLSLRFLSLVSLPACTWTQRRGWKTPHDAWNMCVFSWNNGLGTWWGGVCWFVCRF